MSKGENKKKMMTLEHCYAKQEKRLGNHQRIEILNTVIDVLDMQQTVALVEQYVDQKVPLHLIGVNADKINALYENEQLKQIVNSCGIINADGASVILASKFLGQPLPERVAGIDLMMELVKKAEEKEYGIYLLGAKEEVVQQTAVNLLEQFPKLQIRGIRNGYFKESDWDTVSAEIKAAKPDIVFVGITSPLKEYLVEFFQNDGIDSVFMGVGGSFDVISGQISRAPMWMQKTNLEWLYRVIQEPRRLFKRYFVGNVQFIGKVLKEKRRKTKG